MHYQTLYGTAYKLIMAINEDILLICLKSVSGIVLSPF